MNGQRIRRINIWLVAALFLLACVSPLITTPAVATQVPQMLETIIAQTAAAAQTQTAIFLPTLTFTPTSTPTLIPAITPTPTPTLVPFITISVSPTTIPTATPTVTFVITQAGTASSNGSTGDEEENSDYASVKDKEWACTILEKSPPNGAIIGRGVRFSAVWTLLNRGNKTWPSYGVDFLFKAGMRNEGRARYDLPTSIISGGRIRLDVTITAPKVPGAYRSIWSLKVGKRYFCGMSVNFVVK
jgi:hypothetical protein